MKRKEKNHNFEIFCIIIIFLLSLITIIRAYSTNITYDEGYTYIKYVYSNPFYVFKHLFINDTWANNHLLNSFFISFIQFFTGIKYNEFLIRLPNILFYIIYLVVAYYISKDYSYKYLSFSLLVFNYGLNEFGGLARGYGISCSLILTSLFLYKKYLKSNEDKNLPLCFYALMLSCYANTSALIVYMSICVIVLIFFFKNKKLFKYIKNNFIFIIPIFIGTLLIIKYHFMISGEGLPLYGGKSSFYDDVIKSMFVTYGINSKFINIIINGFIAFLIVFVSKEYKKIKNGSIIYVGFTFFIVLYVLTKFTGKPWMTGRTLIPSIPLLILAIIEIINDIKIKQINIVEKLVVLFLGLVFISNVSISSTRDWEDNYNIRNISYNAYYNKDNTDTKKIEANCATQFYREKIKYLYGYDIFE